MDRLNVVILAMALTDTDRGARDADSQQRVFTAEELNALADRGWHWPDLLGVMAACANAVRLQWRPRASSQVVGPDRCGVRWSRRWRAEFGTGRSGGGPSR